MTRSHPSGPHEGGGGHSAPADTGTPDLAALLAASEENASVTRAWLRDATLHALAGDLFASPPEESPGALKILALPAPPPLGGDEATLILLHLAEIPFLGGILRGYFQQSHGHVFDARILSLSVIRPQEGPPQLCADNRSEAHREMLLLFLLSTPVDRALLVEELRAITASVQRSVEDFPAMVRLLSETASAMAHAPEEAAFLNWLAGENFILMGVHTLERREGTFLPAGETSPLGVFRGSQANARLERVMPGVMEEILSILSVTEDPPLLRLAYGLSGCKILYQAGGIDLVAVQRPVPAGQPPRTLVVLGRYSRTGLSSRASSVPLLGEKLRRLLALSGLRETSHLHREFRSLYNRFPLRELFYGDEATLQRWLLRLVEGQESGAVTVDARRGDPGHYMAVLTAFPRNRNRPDLEGEIADLLRQELGCQVTDQGLAENESQRLVVNYLPCSGEAHHLPDANLLARRLREMTATWADRLEIALARQLPQPLARTRWLAFAHAFDALYQSITPPDEAVEDIALLERMRENSERFAALIVRRGTEKLFIKLLVPRSLDLSTSVGIFNHFGIACRHENGCAVTLPNGASWRVQSFEVGGEAPWKRRIQERARLLGEALAAVHAGLLHNDDLNRLVLLQGFSPREVMLVRGLRQYLLQIRPHLSASGVDRILTTHDALTDLLVRAFLARFDPFLEPEDRREMVRAIREESISLLEEVDNLLEDQVLRDLLAIVQAAVRTNYFQNNGVERFALKIDVTRLPAMSGVQPWREVFVFTADMEGIHLRAGPVARGGVRFSDRLEDYRTEILGLMRTQSLKNALIVPTGAKGGFVVTRLDPASAEERSAVILACYRQFIHGLLELTDTHREGRVVSPPQCVTHDGEDPYLVVAADKGTAQFSDSANAIARDPFDFWLGDAFASGGSRGYDHKKIGITARGVWACIRLHFLEMGRDVDQGPPLAVVGIGDMSGDLFGNGMLLCRNLRLMGAFNHRHIFLDPDPDPEASYRERARLFSRPGSSWSDFDPRLISPGGGVFDRSAKAIPLNPALRELLEVGDDHLSGEEVIRALLRAPVDLLFNGGIGTYVKASHERNAEIQDKVNDRVRVDGRHVRAKVVAEGGNLGFTHGARMEYALGGGRINADALDNAGGVNLSDHEVNLKILLDRLRQRGRLESSEMRQHLLQRLTGEVVEQVLAAQRAQHLAVSLDRIHAQRQPEALAEEMALLAQHERISLEEGFPTAETLREWSQGPGIPRPLLVVLLGHAKIFLRRVLLDSELVEMFYCQRFLADYFPPSLVREFGGELEEHVLRREILATTLANRLLDQGGAGLFLRAWAATARLRPDGLPLLIKSYLIVEALLDAQEFRDLLPVGSVHEPVRLEALYALEELLWHLAQGMAAHMAPERISTDVIALYGRMVGSFREALWDNLPRLVTPARMALLNELREGERAKGLPEAVATTLVLLPILREVMTILRIKEALHVRFEVVGHLFIHVEDALGLHWIGEGIAQGRRRMDRWGAMMQGNLMLELGDIRAQLVKGVITFKRADESPQMAFDEYLQQVAGIHAAYQTMLTEMQQQGVRDLLPLAVLVSRLRELLPTERRGTCL